MKKIIYIFTVLILITSCDANSFLEKIGLKQKITNVIQERDGVAYLPNASEPFTGIYEALYEGKLLSKATYKNGIIANETVWLWYENGQKQDEANYKNGKLDGTYTIWYENGQKQNEVNYKDGKKNGLSTFWVNGEKLNEIIYKDDQKESGIMYINGKAMKM